MEKTVNDGCKGCAYLRHIYEQMPYCSYILDTSKKRPCPPGKGCTVKKRKRKKISGG